MLHFPKSNLFINQDFQKSFKSMAIFANCFGLLSVDGVTSDFVHELKFHWLSLKTVYAFCLLFLGGFRLTANILYLFQKYSFPAMSK